MSQYDAIVLSIRDDEMAEVIIQPAHTGIPGVSAQLNQRFCHCASDGSAVKVPTLNTVGAEAGDRVVVMYDTSVFLKNAVALLGIPVISLIIGIALTAVLMRGFTDSLAGGLVAGSGVLGLGIVLGVFAFRRVSADRQFIIQRIVEKKGDGTRASGPGQSCKQRNEFPCKGCSGPVS